MQARQWFPDMKLCRGRHRDQALTANNSTAQIIEHEEPYSICNDTHLTKFLCLYCRVLLCACLTENQQQHTGVP